MKRKVNYLEDLGDITLHITVEETGPKLPDSILKEIVGNFSTKKNEETDNEEEQ